MQNLCKPQIICLFSCCTITLFLSPTTLQLLVTYFILLIKLGHWFPYNSWFVWCFYRGKQFCWKS